MTRDVWVCWSMTSLTSTGQGSVSIHGRSRASPGALRRSTRRNAVWSLRPDVATVRTLSFRGELSLPDHHLASEVADFETVLVETLGFDRDDTRSSLDLEGVFSSTRVSA